jgi:cytosine permease
MTGDFVRWNKNPKQAWAVTAIAFPVCNLITLLIGALYTAVAGELDFFFGLSAVALGIPIMVMQWASNGSVCDGCLYNAGQGFKNIIYYITKGKANYSWRKITMVVMFIGAAIAATNVINNIVPWLETIGILVPLVGGILIGHFWIVTRKNTIEEHLAAADKKVNVPAIMGLLSGLLIAILVRLFAPDLPPVIGGLIGGIVVYPIIAKLRGYFNNGMLTAKAFGTNIVYGNSSAAAAATSDKPGNSISTNGAVDQKYSQDFNPKDKRGNNDNDNDNNSKISADGRRGDQ